MSELIKKLEAAPEGSRALDKEIHWHLFGMHPSDFKRTPAFTIDKDQGLILPRYTTSIDAALTLVPDGTYIEIIGCFGNMPSGGAKLTDLDQNEILGAAQTPALALCIVALKAQE